MNTHEELCRRFGIVITDLDSLTAESFIQALRAETPSLQTDDPENQKKFQQFLQEPNHTFRTDLNTVLIGLEKFLKYFNLMIAEGRDNHSLQNIQRQASNLLHSFQIYAYFCLIEYDGENPTPEEKARFALANGLRDLFSPVLSKIVKDIDQYFTENIDTVMANFAQDLELLDPGIKRINVGESTLEPEESLAELHR